MNPQETGDRTEVLRLEGPPRETITLKIELDASDHMPRIGCGLAGGDWAEIEPMITETLCAAGIEVVVYDL